MTPRERAEKIVAEWEENSINPFDKAIKGRLIATITKAFEDIVEEALDERDQEQWCKDK